jgi:hypothetical protein
MKKAQYALSICGNDENLAELTDLESLPRFEIGDHFAYHFFDRTCDLGWRAVVTDAFYEFSGTQLKPAIKLCLRIREETVGEQSERRHKTGSTH